MSVTPPPAVPPRGRFQGVLQILRFNWPMYATAVVAAVATVVVIEIAPLPPFVRLVSLGAAAVGLFWTAASLAVSFWVYDLSPLCHWRWIADVLPVPPVTWLNVHCGFDESTLSLRALFPGSAGRTLDIFDAPAMTEPSIVRARALPTGQPTAEAADYRHLPADDNSVDAVFLLLAAHELRSPAARADLFRELHRVVGADGRVVVTEHLRDAANFVAFGPGFVHFHSRAAWLAAFCDSGWVVESERRITPFVAVFVLRRPA